MKGSQYNRDRTVPQPFDAVLVIAFGGPQGPSDIRPFLENVLRGRRVAPGRIEEVAHHYDVVGGRSPITELTARQADGLRERLKSSPAPLPVYVGMRNWHPYLADTLAEMSRAGIRRAVGFIAAAHRSYSSCTQYRENVADARASLARQGLADVEITYVADWFNHPSFIAANADRVRSAIERLNPTVRDRAQLVFTAHSIPESMAARYPYKQQFEETARLVAEKVVASRDLVRLKPDTTEADLVRLKPVTTENADVVSGFSRTKSLVMVYQSRSGRPEDPWLGPDICDYLRSARAEGLKAAVIVPVGFVCDHVEVLYDLDVEAAEVCREIGLPMVRALAVNDHPYFIDLMADVVLSVCRRYEHARPLELVAAP
jgi:protoporphyrin/coproporphyrin ferrochelatase